MRDFREFADADWRRDVKGKALSEEEWSREMRARTDELNRLRAAGGGEQFRDKDRDRAKQLLGEIQVLNDMPDPAHSMRHPSPTGRQPSSATESGEFGRLEGIGRAFVDEMMRQNGGQLHAAFDGTTGGATLPDAFFDPRLRELPQRQLFVRSVIPTLEVEGTDKVGYVRQTVFTNNAAPVASGGLKPTSVITVERKEAPIRVIAHVSEGIDRMLLSDYDQLTNFVDNQLRLGVLLAEENQILNGDGTGVNLLGILNTSGIQTQAKGADSVPTAIYKAITLVRQVFAEPDAVVMHPVDWQDVATLQAADGTFLWGTPATEAEPRIWGKRVIVSPVIAQNTALVGAFGVGAQVYQREGARVSFTESGISDTAGQDLYMRNQIRFRGESRLGLAVIRPNFFCTVTGV